MRICNEGRRKNRGCRYNNDSSRYARDSTALFASVLKISYVLITKDEHSFLLCLRYSSLLKYVSDGFRHDDGTLSFVLDANIAIISAYFKLFLII